jgi:hypothetical protein
LSALPLGSTFLFVRRADCLAWVALASLLTSGCQSSPANLPSSKSSGRGRIVAGIRLVVPDQSVAASCRRAAARLGYPVPCPGLVPQTPDSVLACPCVFARGFAMEDEFAGPEDYRGVDRSPIGHLYFLAARTTNRRAKYVGCKGARPVRNVRVHGKRARLLSCPDNGSGGNSGHLLVSWMKSGVQYVVSLHGHNPTNRKVVLALARGVRLV